MSRKIKRILQKKSGRSGGSVRVRHQGGRHKRFLRVVDYKRDKKDVWGLVETIEYDPNRTADVALIKYSDGDRRYIIAPDGLEVGQKVISSENAPLKVGNALPLAKIPVGSSIHNIEIRPGKGGQMVKGAGSVALVHGKEEKYILVKLPSSEIKRFNPASLATLGQVGRVELGTIRLEKAGKKRRMGIRPSVRGTAQHPGAHPHGGGEGRSGVGRKSPMTVYGRKAVGKTRRKRKYSDKLIVQKRKPGKHSN